MSLFSNVSVFSVFTCGFQVWFDFCMIKLLVCLEFNKKKFG